MKALVTGGTGFVGAWVARLLSQQGHSVRVLHRPKSKRHALEGVDYESALGNVIDPDSLVRACQGCDWVFHVAAVADYWRADDAYLQRVNVDGTRNVLEAARAAEVRRVIFTSSAAAVGFHQERPSTEDDPFNLPPQRFPYGYSKWRAEQVVADYVAAGLDVVIVNPVAILGPGDLNQISGSFIIQTKRYGLLTPITSGGVSLIDVRDVAALHLAAAERGRTGQRYILMRENMDYRTLFSLIAREVGVRAPRVVIPDPLLPPIANVIDLLRRAGWRTPIDANQVRLGGQRVYFDGSKARAELGEALIPMSQSIAESAAWYKAHNML
ncbi:MAG: NAD-dependent epimerase/dehydratase family protein [Anaerolineae bacterium]|nr:NAD-dependent epimerase/dehydratase family protein [Anaerolineae bacterium]MDW8171886.1 NAD-dependent epimerase/dehydratase family protein [Anaerolineae bacterium]